MSLFPIELLPIPVPSSLVIARRSCFAVFYLESRRFGPCFHFDEHFRRFDVASRKITAAPIRKDTFG